MKKILLIAYLFAITLVCQAQIPSSSKIFEILGVLIPPPNFNIEELLQKRGYKFTESTKDRAGNYDQIAYVYWNVATNNHYMISYVENNAIAVYYDTFDEGEYDNILKDAKTIGFKYKYNRVDQVERIDNLYVLDNIALTFTKKLKKSKPYFVIKVVEISIWNKYFK